MITFKVEIPTHGIFEVTSAQMDWAANHYLPASIADLRKRVNDGLSWTLDYGDVDSVSVLLVVLADMYAPDYVR